MAKLHPILQIECICPTCVFWGRRWLREEIPCSPALARRCLFHWATKDLGALSRVQRKNEGLNLV